MVIVSSQPHIIEPGFETDMPLAATEQVQSEKDNYMSDIALATFEDIGWIYGMI
jgi:hypothetical protein